MKFLSVILISLCASIALACPNLTGSFLCSDDGMGNEKISISQEVVNGVTTYTITDRDGTYQLPTDNVEYPIDDPSQNMKGSVRFVCEGDSFNMYQKGEVTDGANKIIQSWSLLRGVRIDANNNLAMSLTGTWAENGQKYPVDESGVCQRQ